MPGPYAFSSAISPCVPCLLPASLPEADSQSAMADFLWRPPPRGWRGLRGLPLRGLASLPDGGPSWLSASIREGSRVTMMISTSRTPPCHMRVDRAWQPPCSRQLE